MGYTYTTVRPERSAKPMTGPELLTSSWDGMGMPGR
jgi:hypothetical protein